MGGPVGILTGTEQKRPGDATETSHSLFSREAGGHASSKPARADRRVHLAPTRRAFTWIWNASAFKSY